MKDIKQITVKFSSASTITKEVRSLVVGDKTCKLTDESMNLHKHDKLNSKLIDESLRFRKRCATIEAVIQVLFSGKDSKDLRRHARKEFKQAAETVTAGLQSYSRIPSSTRYLTLQQNLKDFSDVLYGANYALRVLKAEAEDEALPIPSESRTVGAHWLKIVGKIEKMSAEIAGNTSDSIKETAKEIEASDWHPVKGE